MPLFNNRHARRRKAALAKAGKTDDQIVISAAGKGAISKAAHNHSRVAINTAIKVPASLFREFQE